MQRWFLVRPCILLTIVQTHTALKKQEMKMSMAQLCGKKKYFLKSMVVAPPGADRAVLCDMTPLCCWSSSVLTSRRPPGCLAPTCRAHLIRRIGDSSFVCEIWLGLFTSLFTASLTEWERENVVTALLFLCYFFLIPCLLLPGHSPAL